MGSMWRGAKRVLGRASVPVLVGLLEACGFLIEFLLVEFLIADLPFEAPRTHGLSLSFFSASCLLRSLMASMGTAGRCLSPARVSVVLLHTGPSKHTLSPAPHTPHRAEQSSLADVHLRACHAQQLFSATGSAAAVAGT